MIPSNLGHSHKNGCGTSTSSNCVIWQGPDIPCLNLCNGDTVSSVIAKMGESLCDIVNGINTQTDAEINISDFSFRCLEDQTGDTYDNFPALIDAMVAELCTLIADSGGSDINCNLCTVNL